MPTINSMFASRCFRGARVHSTAFFIVCIISIFAYGYFIRTTGKKDMLEGMVVDDPAVDNLDGWAVSHFVFWSILGVWFPGNYLQALGASLAWEGFEDCLGRSQLTIGGSRMQLVGNTGDDTPDEQYWYGRYTTDTAYNLMGYICGSALSERYWPQDPGACPARG